tara:strand:+ start:314 stop:1315 length:1002 start_codon:yes stop_codon:yes gene_type:complete
MKRIKLIQIDGKLPNLALMKMSSYFKNQGHEITFTRSVERTLFDLEYDEVYGSSIFLFSKNRIEKLKKNYPNAIIGGTGTDDWRKCIGDHIDLNWNKLDYSLYPDYKFSIGFSQRGCRLKCKFCVVPTKEGKNKADQTINEIWRGEPYPKKIHLLDNDFFGQPQNDWEYKINEIKDGNFQVCFNQGINIRLIDDIVAKNLSEIKYRDDSFKHKRIYTAWDNIGDEKRFFQGVDKLTKYGIKTNHIMAYMLIGYDKRETWEKIWYRFNKMVKVGILPYPMVYDPLQNKKDLKLFQRYVIRGDYRHKNYDEYLRHYYNRNINEYNKIMELDFAKT